METIQFNLSEQQPDIWICSNNKVYKLKSERNYRVIGLIPVSNKNSVITGRICEWDRN